MDLKGKVCLVTGGSSGIGASTALRLRRKGARVVSVSRSGSKQEQGLVSGHSTGLPIHSMKADVSDPDACRLSVEQVAREFGRLDVLIHSAGGPSPGGLLEVSEDCWMEAFALHVHAIFHLSRAAVPHMAKQGEGAIILLGSVAGLRGCLGALAYGVAKGSLPQFARALARELADQKIRVNCVSPGVIRTPFQSHLTPEQVHTNIQTRIPLHREGLPDDVARLIESVIENDFITGENFVIDGGMSMRIV
jgi:3-oxoacyl-[acyl-carrier protein] reductase